MSVVIATPTGKVGARVTQQLLYAGEKPVLLTRRPDKVMHFVQQGALVQDGDLTDEEYVLRATRGARLLFWVTPTAYTATDLRSYQKRLGKLVARAIKENRIPRVVNISSLGAQRKHGNGPADGLHDVERAIDKVATHVTHLRPGMFMENYLNTLVSIRQDGNVYLPMGGPVRLPLVAAADVGDLAASVLLDTAWSGQRALTVFGPRELTCDEAAEVLAHVLERRVEHEELNDEPAAGALMASGLSNDVAQQFVRYYRSLENGNLTEGLPETPDVRGTTSFEEFAREVLRPAYIAQ